MDNKRYSDVYVVTFRDADYVEVLRVFTSKAMADCFAEEQRAKLCSPDFFEWQEVVVWEETMVSKVPWYHGMLWWYQRMVSKAYWFKFRLIGLARKFLTKD